MLLLLSSSELMPSNIFSYYLCVTIHANTLLEIFHIKEVKMPQKETLYKHPNPIVTCGGFKEKVLACPNSQIWI